MTINYHYAKVIAILCLLVFFTSGKMPGQGKDIFFKHLTTNNGLSSNEVRAVFQDSNGFMWFATTDGLNRWDGYKFDIYRNYNDDQNSLPGNFLLCIAEDKHKNIWIGTNHGGLAKFSTIEEKFERYSLIPGDETSLPGMVVRCIYTDKHGNVWIGTHSGLAEYNPETNNFSRIPFPNLGTAPDIREIIPAQNNELIIQTHKGLFKLNPAHRTIRKFEIDAPNFDKELLNYNNPLCFDSQGFLWIGARSGLIRLNTKTGSYKKYLPGNNQKNSINSSNFSIIFEDSRKNIWIGTENRGINLYNPATDDFYSFTAEVYNKNSLSSNIISNIYEDQNATVWISTLEGGVSYFSHKRKPFGYYTHNPFDANSLSSNKVGAFYEDNNGFIWIGTADGGLNKFSPKEKTFTRFQLKTDYIAPCILNIEGSVDNSLYLTGLRIGLYNFDMTGSKFTSLMRNVQTANFQPILNIPDIGIDSKGYVWLITHEKDGIIVYNPKTGDFYNAKSCGSFNKGILSVPYAVSMKEDSKKRIWLISYLGLYMLDSTVHTFLSNNKDNTTLSSNYLYTLFEDSKNNIWIGSSKGLDKLVEKNGSISFERYNEKYDLPENVRGILEDEHCNLWLSSNKGIFKFSPETRRIKNIKFDNELENHEFSERVCYKSSTGEMYFGGTNGFIRFNPDSLDETIKSSNIFITDFQIFNVSQKAGKNSPLKKSIIYTNEIELDYDQSVISFAYAALDYSNNASTEYAYIMDGFEEKWNFAGEKRFATYTNLSPGIYTFRVRLANGTQFSDYKETAIKIIINPPFWRTRIAYVFYVILVLTVLYLFRKAIINREKLKNELQLEKNEIKNVREANMMKLRFFTNISHEFRTPLTLIKAPVEKLISSQNQINHDEQQTLFSLIQSNSNKLLNMVNQLLDYRKLEAGSLVLEPSDGDIIDFCRKTWLIFTLLAEQRGITYTFQTTTDSQIMSFDADKIDKVVTNLLSNALKFTPDGGQVSLVISKIEEPVSGKQLIEIVVKDTGIGIPEKDVNQIFNRFYTVSREGARKFEGTGIGLTLVKELTELHNGTISVKSKENEGSEFTVKIPIISTVKASIIDTKEKQDSNKSFFSEDDIDRIIDGKPLAGKQKIGKRKILIVEDDNDLRKFISNELSSDYDVLVATDGQEGLEMAFTNHPNLIVSDIVMPHLDGIEFCKRIKSDDRTSHLPVILLSALHSHEKQMEGLGSGADDYVFKPFNVALLKMRIKNLLISRYELSQKFANSTSLNFDAENVNNNDKKLIQSVIDIVLENITNEKINADFISDKLLISRSLLYIKIEALTGQSVNEFVRNIRLKKATSLLLQKNCNVTDVAYSVGFSSQSYFSRCFTKRFGKSPKDFMLISK